MQNINLCSVISHQIIFIKKNEKNHTKLLLKRLFEKEIIELIRVSKKDVKLGKKPM